MYLENAIGQYSSLPSVQLFCHICPAFEASCYDPYVKCNEAIGNYQYYSKCYNFKNDQILMNSNYTWEQVVIALTTTSEALREFPPNIYWMEKINKAGNISEFFIVSASIEQAIIAVIAILGIRFYAKIARFLVIFPQLCMLICIIYATAKAGSQNTLASIAEGFSPNPQKFLDLKVWVTAALQAFGDIRVRYFYFSLILSMLAFVELLVCIHIYHLKRLIVNLHTMLGEPPNNFWRYLGYPVNLYWTACWYIITPVFCIASGGLALFIIISGRLYSDIIALTVITFLPLSVIIIIMMIYITKAYGTGKAIKSLFVADHRWVPELGINRQQALYEERAARAMI
uniref:Uncharacterized protein n=2 Tax=Wuchereria bancrofti TaxID=6293 RepID=A0AAF5PM63_WUCBA